VDRDRRRHSGAGSPGRNAPKEKRGAQEERLNGWAMTADKAAQRDKEVPSLVDPHASGLTSAERLARQLRGEPAPAWTLASPMQVRRAKTLPTPTPTAENAGKVQRAEERDVRKINLLNNRLWDGLRDQL